MPDQTLANRFYEICFEPHIALMHSRLRMRGIKNGHDQDDIIESARLKLLGFAFSYQESLSDQLNCSNHAGIVWWAFRCALNDMWRQRRRKREFCASEFPKITLEQMNSRIDPSRLKQSWLHSAIPKLRKEDRDLVTKLLDGHSRKKLADELQVHKATITKRFGRIFQDLRQIAEGDDAEC